MPSTWRTMQQARCIAGTQTALATPVEYGAQQRQRDRDQPAAKRVQGLCQHAERRVRPVQERLHRWKAATHNPCRGNSHALASGVAHWQLQAPLQRGIDTCCIPAACPPRMAACEGSGNAAPQSTSFTYSHARWARLSLRCSEPAAAAAPCILLPPLGPASRAAVSSSISLAARLPCRWGACPRGCSSTACSSCAWLLLWGEGGSIWPLPSGELVSRWRGASGSGWNGTSGSRGLPRADPGRLPLRPRSRSLMVGCFCRPAADGSSSLSLRAGAGGWPAASASAARAALRRMRWIANVNCQSVAAAAGARAQGARRGGCETQQQQAAAADSGSSLPAPVPPRRRTNVKRSVRDAQPLALVTQGAAEHGAWVPTERGHKHQRHVAHVACTGVPTAGQGRIPACLPCGLLLVEGAAGPANLPPGARAAAAAAARRRTKGNGNEGQRAKLGRCAQRAGGQRAQAQPDDNAAGRRGGGAGGSVRGGIAQQSPAQRRRQQCAQRA